MLLILYAYRGKIENVLINRGGYDYASNPQYYAQLSQFEKLPGNYDIVFLGDSITARFNTSEFFSDYCTVNRGIGSDTSEGVLNRLGEVEEHKPNKIFLMIGINDLANNIEKDTIVKNVSNIVLDVREKLPETEIYIESILPSKDVKLNEIDKVNCEYKKIAEKYDNIIYIDLYSHFIDNNEMISKYYSSDGTHLTGDGYSTVVKLISPYLK